MKKRGIDYDKYLHTYVTTIWNHRGVWHGIVDCREEDYDYESEFAGFNLSTLKAHIQRAKFDLRQKKIAYHECENFVKAVSQYNNFDPESPTAKAMFRQLNRKKKEVIDLQAKIDFLKDSYKDMVDTREKIVKKIRENTAEAKNS